VVAGRARANGMGLDGIDVIVDMANEGQAVGIYGADFALKSLARVGARMGLRIEISSDRKLTVVRRVMDCD
jgi:hypothetical protein